MKLVIKKCLSYIVYPDHFTKQAISYRAANANHMFNALNLPWSRLQQAVTVVAKNEKHINYNGIEKGKQTNF